MSCFSFLVSPPSNPLVLVQDSEQAGVEAACKLMANFTRVVRDITNPGPMNIDGKELTQTELKRVDPDAEPYVRAMLSAVCCRLLGQEVPGPSMEEALVWKQAAMFFSNRIQGTLQEMPGRAPDMTSAQAAAMRTVLAEMEAACRVMSNFETVVQDITNPGPGGVKGGQ